VKKRLLWISVASSFVVFLIMLGLSNYLAGKQDSQNMAERWSEEKDVAQISCFFSPNAAISEDTIEGFRRSLDVSLQEASIYRETENEDARMWADAYSADGQISLSSDRATIQADAIGIGGDFFLFHPLKLLEGAYFSGNDVNQDYCVIDEDAAWQLFGSNDVEGQIVYIAEIPHIISGVVERPRGRLEDAAGLTDTLVYVSYQTLNTLGMHSGINHYEIVMPDPVKNYAYQLVAGQLGSNEKEVEVIENTSRYSLLNRVKLLTKFGTRSMNGKAIIYPYWENIARGYEDIIGLITLGAMLFLIYPVAVILVTVILWWRHREWTWKDVWHSLRDKAEQLTEKNRKKGFRPFWKRNQEDEEDEWL